MLTVGVDAGSSGGSLRDILFHCIHVLGKPVAQYVNLARQSFEHFHAITGFHRRPHYQLAKNALIDPDFLTHQEEEREQEREREAKQKNSKKREVWAPRRKADTSNWVRVTSEQWERIRKMGCRQMLQMAVRAFVVVVVRAFHMVPPVTPSFSFCDSSATREPSLTRLDMFVSDLYVASVCSKSWGP